MVSLSVSRKRAPAGERRVVYKNDLSELLNLATENEFHTWKSVFLFIIIETAENIVETDFITLQWCASRPNTAADDFEVGFLWNLRRSDRSKLPRWNFPPSDSHETQVATWLVAWAKLKSDVCCFYRATD